MRTLILGGAGMLGHKLYQTLCKHHSAAQTFVTVRKSARAYDRLELFAASSVIEGIDVANPDHLHKAFALARPDAVVNCVGIIKQLKEAHDPIPSITINSLLPHQLASLSAACGARFVHISTDCVFSGSGGPYAETSQPDAKDLYGRSKLLGETDAEGEPNAITIRTSIIGREIETASGLVEWFISQSPHCSPGVPPGDCSPGVPPGGCSPGVPPGDCSPGVPPGGGRVRGFKNALFTGFTTLQLSRIIADILYDHVQLRGLWQVSSDSISKFDLLGLIDRSFDLGISIDPDTEFFCDRRLDSTRFREATGFRPLPWPEMIEEMRRDPTPYELWRKK